MTTIQMRLGKAGVAGLATAVALTSAAPTALAGPAERGEDFTFAYDSRDFAAPDGAAAVYKRLDKAIRHHCEASGQKGLKAFTQQQACYKTTMAASESQMPKPLYAYYTATYGAERRS